MVAALRIAPDHFRVRGVMVADHMQDLGHGDGCAKMDHFGCLWRIPLAKLLETVAEEGKGEEEKWAEEKE